MKKYQCPKCKHIFDKQLLYCPNCGTKMKYTSDTNASEQVEQKQELCVVDQEVVYCHKCGTSNQKGNEFCEKCGEPLHKAEEDIVRCPKCGSAQVQFVTKTEGEAFNSSGACCGWLVCGIPGLICGAQGDQRQVVIKKCKKCGHEF